MSVTNQFNKNQDSNTDYESTDDESLFLQKELNLSQYKFNSKTDEIGEGAFGKVYHGHNSKTNEECAIKIQECITLSDRNSIKNEIDLLKSLDHENIISYKDDFQVNNQQYLVTEFCQISLLEALQSNEYFSETITKEIMRSLLNAIAYCHSKKVVHRDLKLDNILLQQQKESDKIKIIDFGCSAKLEEGQKFSQPCGSIFYIAPEVFQGEYDSKCDMWSLGVIMFSLLTGRFPFDSTDDLEIIQQATVGKVKFLKKEKQRISKGARKFIKQLIRKKPEKRYSAEEALNSTFMSEEEDSQQ